VLLKEWKHSVFSKQVQQRSMAMDWMLKRRSLALADLNVFINIIELKFERDIWALF
jgi:hypothetical protein